MPLLDPRKCITGENASAEEKERIYRQCKLANVPMHQMPAFLVDNDQQRAEWLNAIISQAQFEDFRHAKHSEPILVYFFRIIYFEGTNSGAPRRAKAKRFLHRVEIC